MLSPHARHALVFPRGVLYLQAAKQGKADIISALLASGSPVDVKKKEGGQTPLLAAAEEDFVVCVQLLLDAGADINKTNNAGKGHLYTSVRL